ncbi:Xanthan lyase precursor [Roseimaritima multifibrata]|uniref:Xanthan lyase n=2 Tax=Roseimaritima multifibrata TaxID=1930274 RepID=A0A517MDF8_9BACT|nr:Xanthan lyase precursor [Roseimaritima multifibrata]
MSLTMVTNPPMKKLISHSRDLKASHGAEVNFWKQRVCRIGLWALAVAFVSSHAMAAPPVRNYDVVVYGGTSAGVAAAIQAKRMGKTSVIVCPDLHLGGLTSSGLGWTDSGKKSAVGGFAREFYQKLKAHYDQPSAWRQQKASEYSRYSADQDAMWVFEPHVAEAAYEAMIAEAQVPVYRDSWLDRESGVKKEGTQIVSIRMLDGQVYAGKIFIDATYEGDLMAAAEVDFHIGREANSVYGETLNGIQKVRTTKHQFDYAVSPYVVPDDPQSGLLPRIHDKPIAADGEGDNGVQAYCYRMCLTNFDDNRVPFPKPDNYDPMQYELLARYLDGGWRQVWRKFDPAPNHKTDTNNHGAFSTDNIGMNYDYPAASYERREEILQEHRDYQQGLMWFLANDPRTPADVRERMSKWGLCKDEFQSSGHWPHQIYVREARRMVSDFVMTELHLTKKKPTPKSIGLGSYNMDSHNIQRYVDASGHARNEGDIQVSPGGPYQISYEAIIPKSEQCTNLLVPVCLSSSHIAYGSIRMEPVFMILGQSAATAAALAIDSEQSVQEVPYEQLKKQLLEDKQVLEYDIKNEPPAGLLPKALPGSVVDDTAATLSVGWQTSGSVKPYVLYGYLHDGNERKGELEATYTSELKPGRYEVRVSYTANPNRASNVPVVVSHADGETEKQVDQRKSPESENGFHSVGTYRFDKTGKVQISNSGTTGHVIIDAVQFLPR